MYTMIFLPALCAMQNLVWILAELISDTVPHIFIALSSTSTNLLPSKIVLIVFRTMLV